MNSIITFKKIQIIPSLNHAFGIGRPILVIFINKSTGKKIHRYIKNEKFSLQMLSLESYIPTYSFISSPDGPDH